ncbi:MAG: type II secretion system minor pseudopilin GspJ [Halofilum sp. (in: g-proteobacteria)]
MRRAQVGVTLLELLIAVAVFAVIGIAAYTGLFAVLDARATTQVRAERLAEVQFGVGRLADDLRQAVDRSAYAAQPAARRPLTTEPEGDGLFALTRAGWANPAGLPRSTLARVTWQLEEDRLLRHVRRSVDGGTGGEPLTRIALEGVDSVELRFRGVGEEWHDRWPPLNRDPTAAELPRAVEVTLELRDWGRIRRLFALPAAAPLAIPGGDDA